MAPLFEVATNKQPDNVQHPAEAGPRSQEVDNGVDKVKIGADGCKVDPMEELVGALFDPIIVYPGGGWENDLPEPLKKRLVPDRLIHNMACHKGLESWAEATDLEALLYMYPRTMEAPLDHDWTEIYLYLGTRVMGDSMPGDIAKQALDNYQMSKLRDLKRFIQSKKLQHRKERRRQEKADAKQAAVAAQYEQMSLM